MASAKILRQFLGFDETTGASSFLIFWPLIQIIWDMSALRNPEVTRQNILEIAAEEMALKGYQGVSLSDILEKCGVSKGALYYHFKSKNELGYAVFEEVFVETHLKKWYRALCGKDPIQGLINFIEREAAQLTEQSMSHGCPVNTISQEMSFVDEGFRVRVYRMFNRQAEMIEQEFTRGQKTGVIRKDIDVQSVAQFIIASFQGYACVTKSCRSTKYVAHWRQAQIEYLKGLKA